MSGCWHVWKVVEKVEHPSLLEALDSVGMRLTKSRGTESLHERSVIVTYRCEKCGSEKVERV